MRAIPLVLTVLFVVSWSPKLSAALLGVPGASKGDAWNNGGYVLLNRHDYTNAKKYFNTAIREAPYQWRGYYNRAVVFYSQNDLQAALADLNTSIRLEPAFFPSELGALGSLPTIAQLPRTLERFERIGQGHLSDAKPGRTRDVFESTRLDLRNVSGCLVPRRKTRGR